MAEDWRNPPSQGTLGPKLNIVRETKKLKRSSTSANYHDLKLIRLTYGVFAYVSWLVMTSASGPCRPSQIHTGLLVAHAVHRLEMVSPPADA